MTNNIVRKRDFEKFLKFNCLSIKVVPAGDGYSSLQVFYDNHLIADMNEFQGELDLDWAYEYILDLSGSSYFHSEMIYKKVPKFQTIEEINKIPIL